ncbi:hypothetical protein Celaphus_00001380 [Cervus elaphus hippelaphus]|uniref:Uncharacterized protein n=1 Tax=Cervus elaphus hippelaphus TaxID=46360 RepID=A0A212DAD6_CEREH|nr:hypothetical protein Celaphus_00001380 [Cervus elaphus hippelaphus]
MTRTSRLLLRWPLGLGHPPGNPRPRPPKNAATASHIAQTQDPGAPAIPFSRGCRHHRSLSSSDSSR